MTIRFMKICFVSKEVAGLRGGGEEGGERRRFVQEPAYRQRLSVIRSLSRETVAGAGHMLHHDQPAVVAALIEEFLS